MIKRFLFISVCTLSALSVKAQTTLLQEDFQQGIPSNWTIVINDQNTVDPSVSQFSPGWITVPDTVNSLDSVAAATSFFTIPAQADRWLITPALTLTYGNSINWMARSFDPSYPDDYKVLVSTTDNQLSSFTDTIGLIQAEYEDWTFRDVNLSNLGYNDQTIYVAFIINSYDNYILYLDDINVLKDDPVGIAEHSTIEWTVYPNPATEKLNIRTKSTLQSYEIVDLSGTQIRSGKASGNSIDLDLSLLSSGSYFIQIATTEGKAIKKFIKL